MLVFQIEFMSLTAFPTSGCWMDDSSRVSNQGEAYNRCLLLLSSLNSWFYCSCWKNSSEVFLWRLGSIGSPNCESLRYSTDYCSYAALRFCSSAVLQLCGSAALHCKHYSFFQRHKLMTKTFVPTAQKTRDINGVFGDKVSKQYNIYIASTLGYTVSHFI